MSSPKFEFIDFSDANDHEAEELLQLIKNSNDGCCFSPEDLSSDSEDTESLKDEERSNSFTFNPPLNEDEKLSGISFFVDGGTAEDIEFQKTPPPPLSNNGSPFPTSCEDTPTPDSAPSPSVEENVHSEQAPPVNMYHVPQNFNAPPPMVPPQAPINVHTMPSPMYHIPTAYQGSHSNHAGTMLNGVYHPHMSHHVPHQHHPSAAPFPPTVHIENCHVNLSPYGNPQHPGAMYNASQTYQGPPPPPQVYNPYNVTDQPVLVHSPKIDADYKRYEIHNRGNYRGRARGRGRRRTRDESERSNSVSSDHSSYSDSGNKISYKDMPAPPTHGYPMMIRYPTYVPYVNPMTRTHAYMVHTSPYYDPYNNPQPNVHMNASQPANVTMMPNENLYNHVPPHNHNEHMQPPPPPPPPFTSSSLVNHEIPVEHSIDSTEQPNFEVDNASPEYEFHVSESSSVIVESYTQITSSTVSFTIPSSSSTTTSEVKEVSLPSDYMSKSDAAIDKVNDDAVPISSPYVDTFKSENFVVDSKPISHNKETTSHADIPKKLDHDNLYIESGPYIKNDNIEKTKVANDNDSFEVENGLNVEALNLKNSSLDADKINNGTNSSANVTPVISEPSQCNAKLLNDTSKVSISSKPPPKFTETIYTNTQMKKIPADSDRKPECGPNLKIDKTVDYQTIRKIEEPRKEETIPRPNSSAHCDLTKVGNASKSNGSPLAWAQKKSWSKVFKPTDEFGNKQVALVTPFNTKENSTPENVKTNVIDGPPASETDDVEKIKIGEKLVEYKLDYNQVCVQPRGLINKNYWCYVNAPLQALMACPSLYNLVSSLTDTAGNNSGNSTTPFINSFVELASEFVPMSPLVVKRSRRDKGSGGISKKDIEVVPGSPLEPTCVYKMLVECKENQFAEGRQQDAEEMLSCVLNGLHDEMVECLKLVGKKNADPNQASFDDASKEVEEEEDGGDEWKIQGPKRKSCITRSTHFSTSPISHIFWGQLRSVLQQGGITTANLQPFNTLPLDIQSPKVETLKDALAQLVSKEEITGFTCPKTNQEVTASNQVMLEDLPRVLILQLKRFIYNKDGGLQKVTKRLQFNVDLDITKDLISASSRSRYQGPQRKYKLFAVVNHEGKEATKGHYVADVFHPGYSSWLRYDDASVVYLPEHAVLKHEPPRVPYLLFYCRSDALGVLPGAHAKTSLNNHHAASSKS